MSRAYYSDTIDDFLMRPTAEIVGTLSMSSGFSVEQTQIDAWVAQIEILRKVLINYSGSASSG